MSSTTEHQKETPPRSDSVSPSKDDDGTHLSKPQDGLPSPAKQTGSAKNELASQLAALKVADENGIYGPWAFGTSDYSVLSDWPGGGVIGIHGTNEPWLLPGRVSHGCVRVENSAIRRLAKLLPIGTPVRIR